MKHLLIATDNLLPRWDGIARFINEVVPKLSGDFRITIAAPAFNGDFSGYENVEVVRFPVSGLKVADYFVSKPSYIKIRKLVRNADLVWTHTLGPIGVLSIFAAKSMKKLLVSSIHSIEWELFTKSLSMNRVFSNIIYVLTKFFARLIYNRADLLIVPSLEIAEFLEWNGIRTQKSVIHLGTDVEKFVPADRKKAKAALGIDPNRHVVGFCGRIGREKDLVTLYRAFRRVQKKDRDALLMIVGQDLAGVTRDFASKACVMVVGAVDNVVPYFQAMDVYVLPSLTETTSLSTMEAMACGIAVLSTRVGAVKDYINDGVNGIFFLKQNAYDLSKKIIRLLDDEALRASLGGNARKTIVERFSWDKTIRRIKEVLEVMS